MSSYDSQVEEFDIYDKMITRILTDSSGNRSEAELIINNDLELKNEIIRYTKIRGSTINRFSRNLFKISSWLSSPWTPGDHYLDIFYRQFFPLTPEDIDTGKLRIFNIINEVTPEFDRLMLSDGFNTNTSYETESYHFILSMLSVWSHIFLKILQKPSILDISKGHLISKFLRSIFTHRVINDNVMCDILRPQLPEQLSYRLISTLYEIVTKDIYTNEDIPDEIMASIEKWLRDNEPHTNSVKFAGKTE